MKTSIVVALLAVGMLVRPQPMTNLQIDQVSGAAVTVSQPTSPHLLNPTEMNNAIGSGISGCYESKASNGDTYVTCCVDLWVFAICVAVNWTAVKSIIPIL